MDGELPVKRKSLGHVTHATPRIDIPGIDLLAEQPGMAFAGLQQPGEHLHRCRLAAAIGTQEAEYFAAPDAEVHVIHSQKIAKAHGQRLGLDGDLGIVQFRHGWDDHSAVTEALLLRQQSDEGCLQGGGASARMQLGRCARGQYLACIHGHQPVEAIRFFHVGCRHDHAHALAVRSDMVDQVPELSTGEGVYPSGRLVQDQEVRVVDQRAAQAQLLLHAARELARRARQEGFQSCAGGQFVDAAAAFGPVVTEQTAEELQVLFHRKRRVEILAKALRHIGDARTYGVAMAGAGHVAAQHLQVALLHDPSACQQRQQAGLAHPVRTDQADHTTGWNVQGDVVEGQRLAIAQADTRQVRDGRWGA